MTVLVTGSDGFIGRAVIERLLAEAVEPVGLDRRPARAHPSHIRRYQCDILDRDRLRSVLREVLPDAVIHLAARTDLRETQSLAGYASNIDGVWNVVDAIRQTSSVRRAIYTSSQLVCRVGHLPAHDQDYCPSTLYGESKVRTEQIVRQEDGDGVEWCIVRPTTVWGPYMNQHYQALLRHIRSGRCFHIGKGPLFKSYGYVGNVAYQYYKLLQAPADAIRCRTFFVADYEPLSLRTYLEALSHGLRGSGLPTMSVPLARILAGFGDALNQIGWKTFPFNRFRLRNILTEYVLDVSPTRDVCGTLPYTFEDGVAATVSWFQSAAS